MKDAFKELADGKFKEGLRKLHDDAAWHDDLDSLDGPFFLGFPGARGWGECLLTASLLKRHARKSGTRIKVFAPAQVKSLLCQDPVFDVIVADSIEEARSSGARPPSAVLASTLTNDLLELPFFGIELGAMPSNPTESSSRIGIAWASMDNWKPIKHKSIPLDKFISIIDDPDAEVVVFQRQLSEEDCNVLRGKFSGRTSIVSDKEMEATDQTEIAREISALDAMVTISTTTAHIAACLGVPVVLLSSKRGGPQWFWQAQAEHGKVIYPTADILLGDAPGGPEEWWLSCVGPAREAFLKRISDK